MDEVWATLTEAPWSRGDLLAAAQVALTVIGFAFALIPLWQTASATAASRELLVGVQRRLLANDLLLLLPTLHEYDDKLVQASRANDPVVAEDTLRTYARTAGHISGILSAEDALKDEILIALLGQAIASVSKAKSDLASGTSGTVSETVATALKKTNKVSVETSSLIARLQRKVD